jgi:isoleucyl-tRNA synthetase
VTGELEVERREKRIGSSLEAAVKVLVPDSQLHDSFDGEDPAEIFITSTAEITTEMPPDNLLRSRTGVEVVGVICSRAPGIKCARSWKYFDPATADPEFPDITPRDAAAVREYRGLAGGQA